MTFSTLAVKQTITSLFNLQSLIHTAYSKLVTVTVTISSYLQSLTIGHILWVHLYSVFSWLCSV